MSIVLCAYNEMGYVALETLLSMNVPISAVFTYEDDEGENCWFRSVRELSIENSLRTITTEDINQPEFVEIVRGLRPKVLLSVYYRHMIKKEIRRIPSVGCFNLHGSLLPKFRGRAPINWQLVYGETVSGVTLHEMVARADAGDIVDQETCEIALEDTALDLVNKMLPLARDIFRRSVPRLLAGTFESARQIEEDATYFGGRKPDDGRIDWTWSALRIHNLVRAVAPPWPGAFSDAEGRRTLILRSNPRGERSHGSPGVVISRDSTLLVTTGDGLLEVLDYRTSDDTKLRAGERI
ncbi:MAG: formyltransferase [Planctomycetes bacterium]|nr:formyltransferase [Planctomycetota bacterium]